MRLFFAIEVGNVMRERAVAVQERLRASIGDDGVKWVDPKLFHLTLRFLGEVDDVLVPTLIGAAESTASGVMPFRLAFDRVGAFPSSKKPQNIWIGGRNPLPDWTRSAQLLSGALAGLGFPDENRPSPPHLTLARVKSRAGEAAVARTLANEAANGEEIAALDVTDLTLMRSEQRPTGPEYTVVASYQLLGAVGRQG